MIIIIHIRVFLIEYFTYTCLPHLYPKSNQRYLSYKFLFVCTCVCVCVTLLLILSLYQLFKRVFIDTLFYLYEKQLLIQYLKSLSLYLCLYVCMHIRHVRKSEQNKIIIDNNNGDKLMWCVE